MAQPYSDLIADCMSALLSLLNAPLLARSHGKIEVLSDAPARSMPSSAVPKLSMVDFSAPQPACLPSMAIKLAPVPMLKAQLHPLESLA